MNAKGIWAAFQCYGFVARDDHGLHCSALGWDSIQWKRQAVTTSTPSGFTQVYL